MDKATIIGLGLGLAMVGFGLFSSAGGNFMMFVNFPSVLITVGGSVAATLVCFRFEQVMKAMKLFQIAMQEKLPTPQEIVGTLVSLAEKARKEGLLALEEEAEKVQDPFFRRGIQLVVDGTDPQLLKSILETELLFLQERHKAGRGIFEAMASFAPAFGLIGTLIGLVAMLVNLDDPKKVGPGMAVAMLTTLYGAIIANVFCLPIANKLKLRSGEEVLLKEVIIEGILSIQAGDNPRIVEEKLKSFFPPEVREALEKEKEGQERIIPLRQETKEA